MSSTTDSSQAHHYELLAIISGTYADTEIERIIGQLTDSITKQSSTIHFMQNVGRRKLAYPIKRQVHGVYVLFEFDAAPSSLKKIDRAMKLTQEVLRHCLARKKKVGAPIQFERPTEEKSRVTERTVSRKTLGEELLGDTALPLSEHEKNDIPRGPSDVSEVSDIEDDTPPVQEETPVMSEEASDEKSSTPKNSASTDEIIKQETDDTEKKSDDTGKKKSKKASYEELDDKLNKLLSDDII